MSVLKVFIWLTDAALVLLVLTFVTFAAALATNAVRCGEEYGDQRVDFDYETRSFYCEAER